MNFGSRLLIALSTLTLTLSIFLASPVAAKTWNDITPGATKKSEVLAKLGAPTKDLNRGGNYARGILYQGKQTPEGSRQVQIFFDETDLVFAIHVFPKTEIKKEQVIKNFGTDYEEKLTDSFRTYFFYKKEGMVVYFQDGNEVVGSFTYQKPSP